MDDFLKGDRGAVYVFLYLLPGFLGVAFYDCLVEGVPLDTFDGVVFVRSMVLVRDLAANVLFALPVVDDGLPGSVSVSIRNNLDRLA